MTVRPVRQGLSPAREVLAMGAGAVASAVGALILGEYEFAGATPYIAGVLFGLAVAELILTVAKTGTLRLVVGAAAASGGGLGWAAWISSGRGVAPFPVLGWVAVVIGALVSGGWVALPSRRHPGRQGAGPPPPPERPEPPPDF